MAAREERTNSQIDSDAKAPQIDDVGVKEEQDPQKESEKTEMIETVLKEAKE